MYKTIIIIVLVGILCFGIGAYFGIQITHEWYLNLAWALMEKGKIKIDIDKQMIETLVWQYKNQIGNCIFMKENASIFYKQGNEVAP